MANTDPRRECQGRNSVRMLLRRLIGAVIRFLVSALLPYSEMRHRRILLAHRKPDGTVWFFEYDSAPDINDGTG